MNITPLHIQTAARKNQKATEGRQVLAPTPLVENLYEQDGSGLHAHVSKSELPLHLLRITPQDQRSRTMVETNLKDRDMAMTAVPEEDSPTNWRILSPSQTDSACRGRPGSWRRFAGLAGGVGDWQRKANRTRRASATGRSPMDSGGRACFKLLGTLVISASTSGLTAALSRFAARWVALKVVHNGCTPLSRPSRFVNLVEK